MALVEIYPVFIIFQLIHTVMLFLDQTKSFHNRRVLYSQINSRLKGLLNIYAHTQNKNTF